MALTFLTILPFLISAPDTVAHCPDDRPIISEGSCASEMDAFVSCIRRTAGESSALSTAEKSDLQGRVQAEVQRLVKGSVSIEGVRKVEKNVVSSYSRSGHPGAEVEIVKTCRRMATPKRTNAKKSTNAKAAPTISDRAVFQLRDNYSQINGENAHDNKQIIEGADKEEVARLKEQIETMKEYSEYAILNPGGADKDASPPLEVTGPIPDSMRPGFTVNDGGTRQLRCDPSAMAAFRRTAAKYPKFPFSFYCLADCLRQAGDENWRDYARTATQIFEKTTKVPVRHPSHDAALAMLRHWDP